MLKIVSLAILSYFNSYWYNSHHPATRLHGLLPYICSTMRLAALLYALYVLVLLSMPCGDAYNVCNDTATIDNTTHSHDDDADDNCSPFCYCACCGNYCTPLVKLTHTAETKIILADNHRFPSINEFTPTGCGNNIWQPPKLS